MTYTKTKHYDKKKSEKSQKKNCYQILSAGIHIEHDPDKMRLQSVSYTTFGGGTKL